MSASEAPRQPMHGSGRLSVDGPLGAEISISDSGFAHVADGVTHLEAELPSGVYTVRWKAGERCRQWIIRLREGALIRVPIDVGAGVIEGAPEDPRIQHAGDLLAHAEVTSKDSALAIVVLSDRSQSHSDLGGQVHLQLPPGTRADREHIGVFSDSAAPYSVDRYHVPPGVLAIRYETGERRVVEQTVYAVAGRTTVVLLHHVAASRATSVKENVRFRSRRGIDPSRTTVVSIDSGAEFKREVDTAELLLHKLRTRDTTLHPSVALEAMRIDDPYLKLYAAAAAMALPGKVIDRLARAISPDFPGFGDGFDHAKALSEQLSQYVDWPDVSCLRWRLNAEESSIVLDSSETLAAPPMLEIMWRWASAYSVYHPSDTNSSVFSSIADRTIPGMEPWLVTTTKPHSRGQALDPAMESTEGVELQLQALVEKLSKAGTHASLVNAASEFSSSAPGVGEVAASVVLNHPVIGAILGSGSPEQWIQPDRRTMAQLAASLAIPLSSLAPAIRSASHDLSQVTEACASEATDLNACDPHKGQFGGASEADGVSVRLESFETTGSAEILALRLVVEALPGVRPLRGKVKFHLHPTFMPSMEVVDVLDGRATLTCYAWGAFTLGVETANGVRLELDVSQDTRLPEWFRER